ncbi:hypothetical protein [Brevibacterium paucivorans]|uniref:hypothetical protein n=1 Tax=Brevibacterium paucivorans TaxID=170994 RepID=UPI003D27665E
MAGAEETDADRTLGRRVLAGELTADEAIAIPLGQIDRAHGITRCSPATGPPNRRPRHLATGRSAVGTGPQNVRTR